MNIRKREPKKRKPIREVETKKDYSGEASPYWDFMIEHQDVRGADMKIQEDPLANPDVFSEETSMYHRPLSSDGEVRLQAIQETLEGLSEQQKKILHLCGNLGYTMEAAATAMKVTLATVQSQLTRARQKVQRRYDKLKTSDE